MEEIRKRKWPVGSKSTFGSRVSNRPVVLPANSAGPFRSLEISKLCATGRRLIAQVCSRHDDAVCPMASPKRPNGRHLSYVTESFGSIQSRQADRSHPMQQTTPSHTESQILAVGVEPSPSYLPESSSEARASPSSSSPFNSELRTSHVTFHRLSSDFVKQDSICSKMYGEVDFSKSAGGVKVSELDRRVWLQGTTAKQDSRHILRVPNDYMEHLSYLRDQSSRNLQHKEISIDQARWSASIRCTTSPTCAAYPKHHVFIHSATIRTVEATANAKIFFETYYDPLLAGAKTPRSLRRQTLEKYLKSANMAEAQIQSEWTRWTVSESDHLRRIRVQRSKPRQGVRYAGPSAAGFESLGVIGKGSFGVVRLVRESVNESGNDRLLRIQNGTQLELGKPPKERGVFAMKVIRKSAMLRSCQEAHLRAERDFLVASEMSRWVVPLHASFQDDTNLYLVMDYMIGGDFLGLLFRKNVLKERHTRWYIAEMILCVEETHRHGWIHRDVKPDNFLISKSGHLKISDFGLAFDGHWSHDQRFFRNHRKTLLELLGIQVQGDEEDLVGDVAKKPPTQLLKGVSQEQKTAMDSIYQAKPSNDEKILHWRNRQGCRHLAASMVGTSQYMAPEVIQGYRYDGRCDWWSIGIIMYECLYGFTPFVSETRQETKNRISAHQTFLVFPPKPPYRVSPDALDLLHRLLQEKEHRLCSRKYRLNDLQGSTPHSLYGQSFLSLEQRGVTTAQRRFVYSNDAGDIKRHHFFSGICWKRHHLSRPPFVPDCVSKEDTKYFDDGTMSDPGDLTSLSIESEPEDDITKILGSSAALEIRVAGVDGQLDPRTKNEHHAEKASVKGKSPAHERKRPRDKVLRDKHLAKQALEIRKQGVFIGYTYRRPRDVPMSEGDEHTGSEY